jgi:hypothetical protein
MLDPLFLPTRKILAGRTASTNCECDVKRSFEKALSKKASWRYNANGVARLQRSREVTETDMRWPTRAPFCTGRHACSDTSRACTVVFVIILGRCVIYYYVVYLYV